MGSIDVCMSKRNKVTDEDNTIDWTLFENLPDLDEKWWKDNSLPSAWPYDYNYDWIYEDMNIMWENIWYPYSPNEFPWDFIFG